MVRHDAGPKQAPGGSAAPAGAISSIGLARAVPGDHRRAAQEGTPPASRRQHSNSAAHKGSRLIPACGVSISKLFYS